MAKNNAAKKPKKNDVKFRNASTGNPGNYPMNEDANFTGTGKTK